jgi:hypothetical protein
LGADSVAGARGKVLFAAESVPGVWERVLFGSKSVPTVWGCFVWSYEYVKIGF